MKGVKMNKHKLKAIVRVIVMMLALINAGLALTGHSPLPITEEQINELFDVIYQAISCAFGVGMTVWSWWKDAPMTKAGQIGHEKTLQEKEDGNNGDIIEEAETGIL